MSAAANELFRAVDGWGTDEGAIHSALRGRTPAEVAAIREIYADHFPGRSLDDDILGEMEGNDLAEAQAALSGDPVAAAVASLRNASEGLGTNEGSIHDTLSGITDPEVRRAVAAEYARQTGESLDTMLSGELSSSELDMAEAEAAGDAAAAAAVRLDQAMNGGTLGIGLGTDEDAIYGALEGCATQEERDALAAAYLERTGRTLATDMGEEMGGADLDVATALQTGDRARAVAARIEAASEGLGTDEGAIFTALEGARTAEEREAIIAAYNQNYGTARGGTDFDAMVSDELGELDAERATQLAEDGELDPAFALRYAMDGIGTDEDMIRRTLAGRSAEEIEEIREAYAADGGDLDADLEDENSGRDGFEISQAMLGEPASPEEEIARMHAAYDFERGSGAGVIGNFVMDNLMGSDAGRVLDAQHDRVVELESRITSGTATSEDLDRLETIGEYHEQDVDGYQATRDSATNAAATGATVVVGGIVTVATAGTASPAVVAALAALGGGAAGIATRAGMQGASYSQEQFAIDAAQTVASAVTAGVLKMDAVAPMLSQIAMVNPAGAASLAEAVRLGAVSGAAGGLVNGVVAGALDENTWRGPGDGLQNFLTTAGMSTLTGTASGAAGAAMGHQFNGAFGVAPNSINQGGQQATTILGGALSGAAGGAAATTTELAVAGLSGRDVGSMDAVLGRYAMSMGTNAISGAADGYATSVHQNLVVAAQRLGIDPAEVYTGANLEAAQAEVARLAELPGPLSPLREGTPGPGEPSMMPVPPVAEPVVNDGTALPVAETTTATPVAETTPLLPETTTATPVAETTPLLPETTPATPVAETTPLPADLAPTLDTAPPATVTDAAPVAPEGRYEHPVYATDQTSGRSPAHAEVLELATAATSPEDYRFVLQQAADAGVELSPAHAAALEAAAAGGDSDAAQAALRAIGDRDALRDLHIDARGDGLVDIGEGEILREWRREAGVDAMPFVEAMDVHGFDPAEMQALFTRAEATDASASVDTESGTNHLASNGTRLAEVGTPGGMSESDVRALFDIAGSALDDQHTGVHASGAPVLDADGVPRPPTTIAKAVPGATVEEFAAGGRLLADGTRRAPALGNDVGPARNTTGQTPTEIATTLGLDYTGSAYYDEGSAGWSAPVRDDGISMVTTPLTPAIDDAMRLPLGTDADAMMRAEAARRLATGEYVPDVMAPMPDGSLSSVRVRNRQDQNDPMTGWGFSATERARAPGGGRLPVTPNIETTMPRFVPLGPGSEVINVNPDGSRTTLATAGDPTPGASAPSTWTDLRPDDAP